MVGQENLDILIAFSAPLGRDVLLLGIGPEVTVVEVHHDGHPQVFGPSGLHQEIFLTIPIAVLGGVNPYAEADGIQPKLLHQSRTFAFLPFPVEEFHAVGFILGGPADIGPFPIVMARGAGKKNKRQRSDLPKMIHFQFFTKIWKNALISIPIRFSRQ